MSTNQRDAAIAVGLVFTFALLVTTHAAIVFGLSAKPPRIRAFAALVVAPLAPYWALREHMRIRGVLWMVAAASYATLYAQASR